jgi:hypothetical protein
MATVALPQPASRGNDWSRKYPPLVLLLLAMVVIAAALPSALNLPQTNPTTTLEYAPVPPTDEDLPDPPPGNFDQFGLGSSNNLEQGGAAGGEGEGVPAADSDPGVPPPPPAGPAAKGKTPSTKRCVGNPPRQTEDPLSPPCVPDFNCQDNGGATYQGVEEKEIRILYYLDSGIVDIGTSKGDETRPQNKYVDLLQEPEQDEHVYPRVLRGWQAYFNDRYQTYCRFVHFYVYFGSRNDAGPEAKRADAADNFAKIKPFAVISESFADNDAYLEAMAKRGVLNFGSFLGRSNDFFNLFPKLVWGYAPPIELQADAYAKYVCTNIKPYPVTIGGSFLGQPRKYGLVYTTDPQQGSFRELKNLVKERLRGCGVEIADEITFPQGCLAANNGTGAGGAAATYADEGVAKFQSQKITTWLWPGCVESKFSASADRAQYYPEIIVLGDGVMDGFLATLYQENRVWQNAVTVGYQPYELDKEQQACFLAYKDADPQAPVRDIRRRACQTYNNLRQLFIGIQVAGPRLGPTSIDRGYHAIPKISSSDPTIPACFYNTDDYTCIKDMVVQYWDPNGQAPNSTEPGCYRMAEDGKRYIVGQYPDGEATSYFRRGQDVCNGFDGSALRSVSP